MFSGMVDVGAICLMLIFDVVIDESSFSIIDKNIGITTFFVTKK